jgi:putative methyltransferase (TIGR01177 family)
MIILETSKEDIELAKQEIESFVEAKQFGNLFLLKDDGVYFRFGLTRRGFRILCDESMVFKHVFPEIPKTFKFEGPVNPHIVNILKDKGSKVDLKNPEKTYSIINVGGNKFCELFYINKKPFLKRDPKFRPGFHPGACKAQLARILVNLSGLKKGKIIDPFCGTGGIIMEASFLGLVAKGYDIEYSMIEKAKKNIAFFKSDATVEIGDALKLNETCDAIITELPFGLSTKIDRSVNDLLLDFLEQVKPCTDKAVIVVPDDKYTIKGWKTTFKHKVYMHKSLSKLILVLEKKD